MVLNVETGLTSPQFHIRFDEQFETIRTNPKLKGLNKWQDITQIKFRPKKIEKIQTNSKRRRLNPNKASDPSTNVQMEPMQDHGPGNQPTNDQHHHNLEGTGPTQSKESPRKETDSSQREAKRNNLPPQREADDVSKELQREADSHKELLAEYTTSQERLKERDLCSTCKNHRRKSNKQIDRDKERTYALRTYRTDIMKQLHHEEITGAPGEINPVALAASMADEDTMYLHEAMKAPDKDKFLEAMKEEISAHSSRKHWEVVKRSSMPKNQQLLKAVWSMKRKRRVATGEIYKWKARLCVDGSRQVKGVNYWDTYAPVVSWESVRAILTLALTKGWVTRQIDFVLAYPQADVECDLYMEIPRMCHVKGDKKEHVLKLKKNLYGSKQAGKVWFQHLLKGLRARGFKQSKADECVFYKGSTIFVVYVDDGILIGPDAHEIDGIIKSLKKDYNLTDEGDLKEYLGIRCDKTRTGGLKLTQPTLIGRILKAVGIDIKSKVRKRRTPANKVLQKDLGGPKRRYSWDYRSVVGMLNFLCRSTRPDLSFAVSQAARFMANPMKSHEDAIMRICEYLHRTRTKGMTMKANGNSFEVFADADFSGGYQKGHTDDPNTAKSRSAYHIMYNGCLIYWSSKLQTEVALSTTEAEYICLSQSLRTTICLMRLF